MCKMSLHSGWIELDWHERNEALVPRPVHSTLKHRTCRQTISLTHRLASFQWCRGVCLVLGFNVAYNPVLIRFWMFYGRQIGKRMERPFLVCHHLLIWLALCFHIHFHDKHGRHGTAVASVFCWCCFSIFFVPSNALVIILLLPL